MRKWHRWLSLFFSVFLLWIAATGVASHVAELAGGEGRHEQERRGAQAGPGAAAGAGIPAGFHCPATMTCRPRRAEGEGRSIVGVLHQLHSGESFGPLGTAISILSGLALLFFAGSGLWLYVQMWRHRKDRNLAPRWFWD